MINELLLRVKEIYRNQLNRDVILSLILRIFNLGFSMILIPLSLNILDVNDYGIWLTIYGLNSWVSLFDLGTQNSLRSLLIVSVNKTKSRMKGLLLVNSFMFTIILCVLTCSISIALYVLVDFSKVLKITSSSGSDINILILMSMLVFGIRLISNNFNAIFQALQKAYIVLLINVISTILILGLFIFCLYFKESISVFLYGSIILIIETVLSFLLPTLILKKLKFSYNFSLKLLSFRFFRRRLLASNLRFFFLSLFIVITFFSNNFFIGIILSYEDVAVYNLVNKYFGLVTTISVVILNPIWTRVAELNSIGDTRSIKRLLQHVQKYLIYFSIFSVFLVLFSSKFYSIIGYNKINVPLLISIVACLSTLQLLYNNIYAYFLNGLTMISIQIICFMIGAILIFPMYYIFCDYFRLGVVGAYLVQIIIFLPNTFVFPIILKRYLNAVHKECL